MSKIFVGLSGGVDSAVAAHLLKKQGHQVTGVFIKGWEPDFLPCTGADDRLSAMRVAAHLGIPFKTYDLSEEYKKSVVDYFVAEYKAGRTPNPDVMCNRTIKFGAMWKRAKKEGAEYIATGHYADTNGAVLRTAADPDKDQSYFLWTLTKKDLEHTLFPLGKLKKTAVRKIAENAKLPNAKRKDSQGLCFLGHVDMHAFLKRFLPSELGDVVTEDGAKVGVHDGAWFYTLGQHVPVSSKKRLFVVAKHENTLVVSERATPSFEMKEMALSGLSFVTGDRPKGPVLAQFRYHGPTVRAELDGETLHLEKPVLVAPGQSAVLYDQQGVLCHGGGIVA